MPGGHMNLEQLTALLNTIPMEITFVDADSINRFFNEGPKVFKRPGMAIDREVFSCHPPKIEPMVRQIIDDFRNNRRDEMPICLEQASRIKIRQKQDTYELFNEDSEDGLTVPTISYEQYKTLTDYLKEEENPALLPIQIAYYTRFRIGEVCVLTWQDIDLKEQTCEKSMVFRESDQQIPIYLNSNTDLKKAFIFLQSISCF